MNRMVVDLEDRRPIWAIPGWAIDELEGALPADWELVVVESGTSGAGDGSSDPSPEVLAAVADARVYVGFGIPAAILEAGPGLEWVHSGAAGVGGSLHPAMLERDVRFTNSAGIHGPPIGETVAGMVLYFARGFDFAVAAQRRREWDEEPFLTADTPVREIAGMTVGIFGYGGIGVEVGDRLRALGCHVIGARRSEGESPVTGQGLEVVSGPDGLDRLLERSDVLVIAAPETDATRDTFTEARLRRLRRGAVVVNIARGRLLDEDALVNLLQEGHIRGAALDVFRSEPLPSDHPFWRLENVLVLPHVSPVTRGFWRRELDLILGNLSRFLEGEPLQNEVDRASGY